MTTEERYYPSEICLECGNKLGKSRGSHAIGMWMGTCGWCGKEGEVTAPRDFRYPDYTGPVPDGWGKEDDHG